MNASPRPGCKPESTGIPLRFAAVLLGLGLLLPGAAAAVVTNSRCVGNLQAPLSPGNSCTANDVTFILVGLGDQTNGCVTTNDTATLFLGAQLQNSTGFTRYDIGMFIYNYLGNDDPTPDAYGGLQCAVETLKPVFATAGVRTCPPLNLSSPTGPYYNADGNTCGDLEKGQCNNAQIAMQFPDPLTIRCTDAIGANGSIQPDGFIDIPTCATWGNNAGQVGPNGVCTDATTVHPGTGSKCNCEIVNSNVPVARLATSCSCTPTAVRPGQSAACTVSITNTIPNCTAAAGPNERFQCGTASFVRLKVGYNAAQGQVLNSSGPPATPADTTGGTTSVDTTNQQVVWTPRNTTLSGTSLGIVGPNQSGSMTYQFRVDPSVASGTTINQTATVYWANGAGFGNEEAQPLTATCSFQVSNAATWARVSSFAAWEDDGRVVVEWETAAEVGTAAFEIERQDPESGRFARVGDRAVPAVEQLPGGRYRLADPTAPRGETLTYRVVEIDQQGQREIFGPFEVAAEGEARRPGDHGNRDFSVRGKDISPRLTQALKSRRNATAKAAAPQPAARLAVEVSRSGMVRVPAREIANGFGLGPEEVAGQLRAGRLRLSRGSQDVAWQPAADGDSLVFYGEEIRTPSTDVNVYWLERAKGQTVATVAVQPAFGPAASSFVETLHLETDAIPAVTAPLPVDDFWIWKSFFPGFPGFDRATFGMDVPAPAAGPATLAVHLYGFAAAQRAALRVNGQDVAEIAWAGAGPHTETAALAPGLLRDGANQIEVVALEGALGFWLDSFDLTYPRSYRAAADRLLFGAPAGGAVALTGFRSADIAVYDVAQPLAPRRLGGLAGQPQPDGTWGLSFLAPGAGPFLAVAGGGLDLAPVRASNPADLRNPGRGAEYVVITPAALRAEAQRLADLRAAQGLTAMVVSLDDVMDVYAHGVKDPLAIQRFLADAVRSWPTPPRYVALAGKGTYDDRNILGFSSSLLPTLLVTLEQGLAPADSGFADFDGDGVPSVAIGRIPAVAPEDLRAYVDKIAAYERAPGGDWTSRALLVADNPDHGGDFPGTSTALAGALPGLGISRIDVPGNGPIDGTRALLQDALRQGYGLVNYVGHGGLDRLDASGLLLTSDVPALGNAPRLPVMTALTCLISQFAHPSFASLGEELVLQRDGGVAALYGPTWLSHNAPASELGRYLLPTLSAPGGGRLGDRLLRGLAAYAEAGGDREMLRVYTLLGDPALVVRR